MYAKGGVIVNNKEKVEKDIAIAKEAAQKKVVFTNPNPLDVEVIVTTGMKDNSKKKDKDDDDSFLGSE
jgi:hypothetical protein